MLSNQYFFYPLCGQLSTLDKAKLDLVGVYTINSLFWSKYIYWQVILANIRYGTFFSLKICLILVI